MSLDEVKNTGEIIFFKAMESVFSVGRDIGGQNSGVQSKATCSHPASVQLC